MRLHGKPEVRRLDPVGSSDSLRLRGHATLVFEGKQMLDDRVAENNIEASVAELAEVHRVSDEGPDVFVLLLFGKEIKV